MKQLFRLSISVVLITFICLFWNFNKLSAQNNLLIQVRVPLVGENRFSVCGDEKKVLVRIENISGGAGITLTDVVARVAFTTLQGFQFSGTLNHLGGKAVSILNPSIPSFSIEDLAQGDTTLFEVGVNVDCGALPRILAGTPSNFNVHVDYNKPGPIPMTETRNTGNFEVVKPSLSIPAIQGNNVPGLTKTGAFASIYDGSLGLTDTIKVSVVNAGDGKLAQFLYWVKDHPLLTNTAVYVGSYSLPIAGTSGDTTFYLVDLNAISQAMPGPNPNNTSYFQFNELIMFKEVWYTDLCSTNFPDIVRGVRYGCDGTVLGRCEQASRTSGLRFGFIRPVLNVRTTWDLLTPAEYAEGIPACYYANKPKQRVIIFNSGTTYADSIKFSLSVYRGELNVSLDTASVMVRIGRYGTPFHPSPYKTWLVAQNGNCPVSGSNIRTADYNLNEFKLNAGDTLWIEYVMDYKTCGCSKDLSYCDMQNWYFAILNWGDPNWASPASYQDPCHLNRYQLAQVNTTDWRAIQSMFVEGPAAIYNNQVQTVNYTGSSVANSWLANRARFPNGIFRVEYIIEKGLDFNGTNGDLATADIKYYGRNGVVWNPSRVQYIDNESTGPDTLYVDYEFSNFPSTFIYSEGLQFKLNVIGDCDETGPPCSQGGTPRIFNRVYFSPDKNCTDCDKGQLVSCTNQLDMQLKCPSCEPCEGLIPLAFNIDRVTKEKPDNNNDYKPDATGSINDNLIALDRFIAGDTLKAVYRGKFVTSVAHPQWEAAFSVMQLPSGFAATLTPLGGSVKITKEDGTMYTADLLQQFPSGTQVITNLHPGNLNYLGNAVPADLVYENNDTVEVTVLFTVSDNTFNEYTDGNVLKPLIIDDYSFATHDTLWDVPAIDRYACDNIRDRVYYVEMKHFLSSANGSNFGGCTLGYNGYDWTGFFIGSNTLDYFPFEYRTPKSYPITHKSYVAPGFEYDRYRWHFYAKDFIGRPNPIGNVTLNSGVYGDLDSPGSINQGYYYGELPITSPYLSIIGDTIIFRVLDFVRDNFGELCADEGFRFAGYPRFRGSCNSPITTNYFYNQKPVYEFSMDPSVFGYSYLRAGRVARAPQNTFDNSNSLAYGYVGAPRLSIQAPIKTQQLIGETTCFEVQLVNTSDYRSDLTWLTVNNTSGGILVNSVKDITNPASPITYTPIVGIYQIGVMNSAVNSLPYTRVFEICVTGNNCSIDSFVVNTGWECKNYPFSLAEADCNNPVTLYVEPVDAQLGMIIKDPEAPVLADLCTTKDYVIQLSSTLLGSLNDVNLQFDLPNGQVYVPGSFMLAYLPPSSGNYLDATWRAVVDPINTVGNTWEINVSSLDSVLRTSGLPGTLMLGKNYLFVKFTTRTTCNYASGGRARFLSWAYNSCGELTNYAYSPAAPLRINGIPEIYKTEVEINADTLNPCNMDESTINVQFAVQPGSIPTGSKDSILVTLPPGVHYKAGSFMVISNAPNISPIIQTINGQEVLIWDISDGLTPGTLVRFKFNIISEDAQQACRAYPITAYTFSSKPATCVADGTTCDVRAISDETEEFITFVKPEIGITNLTTRTRAILPNMEEVCYTFEIKNTGEDAPAGSEITLEVYAEDGDGDLGTGDVKLFQRTFTVALASGDSLTLSACDTVMSGTTCRLMAVINPATSCVCMVQTSFLSYPELDQMFIRADSVCSNTLLTGIGPMPLTKNVKYKWLAYLGSNITALSSVDTTQVNFLMRNTGSTNIIQRFLLRTTRNNQCVDYDTVAITIFPEIRDSIEYQVCVGPNFNLAGPTGGTNYQWTPSVAVVNPNNPETEAYGISEAKRYRLDYLDANGCPAFYIANVDVVDCGNTAIGDTVWLDYNFDGIQDANEPGVSNVQVFMYKGNDLSVPIGSTYTDANGFYIFDTIPAGDYVIKFVLPNGATFTKSNIGSDTKDSDANTTTGFTSSSYVPNGVRNMDYDAGIVFFDWSDAPNTYKTNLAVAGAQHVMIPYLFLGDTVDAETNGFPVTVGTPALGDDNNMTLVNRDDEDGISSFSPLGLGLRGLPYSLSVRATNLTAVNAFLTGWIDFNRNGIFEASEGIQVSVPAGTDNGTFILNYTVPNSLVVGLTYVRLRLTQSASITTSTPAGLALSGEVEDYELEINDKIFDLALTKTINTTSTPGPYGPGSNITFKITITNQGNLDATNVNITDSLPSGLILIDPNWTLSGNKATLVSPLPLVRAGFDTMIDIRCQISPSFRGTSLVNYSEITSASNSLGFPDRDSKPDSNLSNDVGGVPGTTSDNHILDDGNDTDGNGIRDEDDQDPAFVPIIDMALKKVVATAGPYSYGQLLTFNIWIYNQGTVALQNTKVNDYIPSGFGYTAADNPGWSGAAPTVNYTYAPRINPGDSALIVIKLRVLQSTGRSAWTNFAEISEIRDLSNTVVNSLEADSNPGSNGSGETGVLPGSTNDDNINSTNKGGEEDDHDPAGIQVFDLALKKIIVTPPPYTYNTALTFRHWIYNQGNVTASNIQIVDSLPCGYNFLLGNAPTWIYNSVSREATTTLAGPLRPGDSLAIDITLELVACGSSGSFTNISEITSASDTLGVVRSDIDSSPDANQANDGTPINDQVNDPADQDDHDPETIQLWDLALRKWLMTTTTPKYGDLLTFRIAVFNQGTLAARNIVVRDYIPVGFAFAAGDNPGWTGVSPNVNYTIAGPINPGDSAFVEIKLKVQASTGGAKDWINYSEIISSQDLSGTNRTNDDADSGAGSNGLGETGVLPGSTNDNNITSTNRGGEEDDHDPAGIQIFDLALKKYVINPKPSWKYGDTVCFEVKVYNQGSITASDVTILDYIPCGYNFLSLNEPAWIYSSGSRVAQMTLSGNILPGDSVSYPIKLAIAPCSTAGGYVNKAEIFRAEDQFGNNMTNNDIDSKPDNNPSNDAGGVVGTSSDDHVGDDGRDTNADGITDEDDADPAMIQIFDMALKKTVATAGPYSYNQLLTFNIWIYNQGNVAMQNTRVTDYIPSGYSYSAADNIGWTGAAPSVNYVHAPLINPGDSALITIRLRVIRSSGANAWTNYAEITEIRDNTNTIVNSREADSRPASNGAAELAVTPGSTNDDNIISTNFGAEEDDHDPAGIEVFDLALKKVKPAAGTYNYGSTIPFTHWIYNQGNTVARNIQVVDSIPCGLLYLAVNTPTWSYNSVTREAVTIIVGPLNPGDSIAVTIQLQLQPCSGVGSFTNISEISSATDGAGGTKTDIDSSPDGNQANDGTPINDAVNNPADQDDHDPETIEVWDLALKKELVSIPTPAYGETLTFRIKIYNQGTYDVRNIRIADYIPAGYTFSSAINPLWLGAAPTVTTTIPGPIKPGDSLYAEILLILTNTAGGTKDWINYSEILGFTDNAGVDKSSLDIDSKVGSNSASELAILPNSSGDNNIASVDPGGNEDDHDPAGIEVFDLALRKQVATVAGNYLNGDQIHYTVTVFNQGSVPAHNITVIDRYPCGLNFIADPVLNVGWTNPSLGIAEKTISTVLQPGQSIVLDIYFTIDVPAIDCPAGVNGYKNTAEIKSANDPSGNPATDIDSKPNSNTTEENAVEPNYPGDDVVDTSDPDGNQDDHDPADLNVFDLALMKKVDLTYNPGPYRYGDLVKFNIYIINQGNICTKSVTVTDIIPSGYVFDPADNPTWTLVGSNAETTYDEKSLCWKDTAIVSILLEITPSTDANGYVNYSEVSEALDVNGITRTEDNDSKFNTDATDDTGGVPNTPDDDNVSGDGINKGEDEDDHDPAVIEVFDLALRKLVTTPAPYKQGDIINYRIEIYNQGNVAATNIEVVDNLPCGLEFDSALNPNWTWSGTQATTTYAGPLAPLTNDFVEIKLRVKSCNMAGAYTNSAEISKASDSNGDDRSNDDADSTPDSDPNNDGNPVDDEIDNEDGDEDDHDLAIIPVMDIALRKTVVEPERIFLPDESVKFYITVFNQGNVNATNVEITDHIPTGYIYDPISDNYSPAWTNNSGVMTTVIPGPILPQDSAKICVSMIIKKGFEFPTDYYNYAEVSSFADQDGNPAVDMDSDPDDDPANDGPTKDDEIDNADDDEDDIDLALPIFQIYDLALRKTTSANYIKTGEVIEFKIQVFNQGINGTVTDIKVIDYIPSGLEFDAALNPAWTYDGTNATTTIAGPLVDDDSLYVSIFLRVKPGATPANVRNFSEIVSFNDEDGEDVSDRELDSDPDDDPTNDIGGQPNTEEDDRIDDNGSVDEDDHDGAEPKVFDLAIRKTTSRTVPVRTGDVVTFDLEVFNQGNVDAYNVVVNEYIPAGYILSPADPYSWTVVSSTLVTKTIDGPITPGSSVILQVDLQVVDPANLSKLQNVTEIATAEDEDGETPVDIDSDSDDDPDNDGDPIDDAIDDPLDEDDHDIATPPVMDLALRKYTDRVAPVREGDVVKFNIAIYNQGNIATTNMIMVDYMDLGFKFEAQYNPGWSYNGQYVTYNMTSIIEPGKADTACIYLTVLPTATTITLVNKAELVYMENTSGIDMTNYDIDSDPDDDPDNDAGGDAFGPTDDEINGDGNGIIGAGLPAGDEDDEDAEHLVMCGAIACKGNINFSLDSTCMGVLTPGALLSPVTSPLESYMITVKDKWGVPHANKFDGSDVGKCFDVTIIDTLCYGNSCWSRVCIEDKFAPRIVCDTDTVSCARFLADEVLPKVIENCGSYELKLLDERIYPMGCNEFFVKRIERDYIAVDASGNSSDTCTWVLFVERANPALVVFPTDTVLLCSDQYEVDAEGHPHPFVVGVPTLEGDTIWPTTDFLCNINVDYSDIDLGEVRCTRKILRTWRIREWWCNREIVMTAPQIITLIDTVGPKITKRAYNLNTTTSNRSCTAKMILPSIEAHDACHEVLRIDVVYPGGILLNQNGGEVELPVGIDTVIYRVYDNCYNLTTDTITVTVKDNTAPVAICDRRTIVALNHSGYNWVPAEVFDDGSFDECHLHHFEVRRMDANSCGTTGDDDWGTEVGFCCEDVGREIMVAFKAIDFSGNESVCMVLVEIQDKEAPSIVCPPDITVDCRFPIDLTRLSTSFGTIATNQLDRKQIIIDPRYYHVIGGHPQDGLAQDNCPPIIREEVDSSGFDQCGHGVIKRRFIVTDQQGNSAECTQLITVDNFADPFDETNITWPEDFDTVGCDPRLFIPELLVDMNIKQPRFNDDVCSKIGTSYEDHVFGQNIPTDACHKIFRVWKVIDWCNSNNGLPVIFQDTQIIKVINDIPPVITDGCDDDLVCSYDVNCADIPYRFLIKAEDDCTSSDAMLYTFKLDLNSDGSFDVVRSANAGYMVNGTWPVGKHTAIWEVEDLCGNSTKCTQTVELRNCKPPVAYCLYGVAIGLVPMDLNGNGQFDPYPIDNEMDTVWAADLDAGSYHSCRYPVKLSFSSDTNDVFRVFTCDSIGQRFLELWVTDLNGNQSYCRTYVLVQDNNNVNICDNTVNLVSVSGEIKTKDQDRLEKAEVELSTVNTKSMTDYDGKYEFKSMNKGGSYIVDPKKNDDWLNGVTTADIVKIQKHILGIEEFDNPYQYIAADVNKSGAVSTKDISDLRKLILGISSEVSGNESWRFVDANYSFADLQDVLTQPFPESIEIKELNSDLVLNFTGVKIGDLNSSAKTRGLAGIQTRSGNAFVMKIHESIMTANELKSIEFFADNSSEFQAVQFTLEYDPTQISIEEVLGNEVIHFSSANIHVHKPRSNQAYITVSWDGSAADGSRLFSLLVKSKSDLRVSELFKINSTITPALATIDALNEEYKVELQLIDQYESTLFNVSQNVPNPFSDETQVKINLPIAGEVNLSIYDAQGKLFYQSAQQMKQGQNLWKIEKDMLPSSGVYYYQVDFKDQTRTHKMVMTK